MEGKIFQIIREMTEITGKNCQITKRGGGKFSKLVSMDSTFIREMRVHIISQKLNFSVKMKEFIFQHHILTKFSCCNLKFSVHKKETNCSKNS